MQGDEKSLPRPLREARISRRGVRDWGSFEEEISQALALTDRSQRRAMLSRAFLRARQSGAASESLKEANEAADLAVYRARCVELTRDLMEARHVKGTLVQEIQRLKKRLRTVER